MSSAKTSYSTVRRFKAAVLVGACQFLAQGCAVSGGQGPVTLADIHHPSHQAWVANPVIYSKRAQLPLVQKGQAVVVLHRDSSLGDERHPLNVYLDGRFQAALLTQAYTQHVVCAGQVRVNAVFNDAVHLHQGRNQAGQLVQAPEGQVTVMKLVRQGEGVTLVPSDQQALMDQSPLEQVHAISRARTCHQA